MAEAQGNLQRRGNPQDSWIEKLFRYGSVGLMAFMILNQSKPPTGRISPSKLVKPIDLSVDNPSVITFEKAALQTSIRLQQLKQQVRDTAEVMKKLGMPFDETLPYMMPTYPTHNNEGYPLGGHDSVLSAKSISPYLSLFLYFSEQKELDLSTEIKPTWFIPNIFLDWSRNVSSNDFKEITVDIPENVRNAINDSSHNIWCHAIALSQSINAENLFPSYPHLPISNSHIITQKSFELIKYKTIKPKPKLRNLLNDSHPQTIDNDLTANQTNTEWPITKGFWKPTLDLSFVLGIPSYGRNSYPADIAKHLQFTDEGYFLPLLYRNEFWITSKQLIEINSTTESMQLKMSYSHLSFWKWHLQNSMEDQEKKKLSMGLGGTDSEIDMLREVLMDTNPWLLGLTALVTLCHSLFDFLAFKNDIQFWRAKKDMKGMSVRSLLMNCFFQTVIVLYLFDNETSYMILFSSTIGLIIEYWKLSKTMKVKIGRSFFIPTLDFAFDASYSDTSTSSYDKEAISHLLYVIGPAMVGYSAYSLLNQQYRSYYSWILSSLVGFIYVFGFVLMTPQLYVNYKLKSVAHMPWKAMVYKSLNTFIDDLFAFIIKMPILHRLACFRDDIIFFIYLYQRWIYRVDYTRTNEYGHWAAQVKTLSTIRQAK